MDGIGKITYTDGKMYIGEWKNNKMEGVGLFYWPDNKIFIGTYLKEMKNGFGIFIWPSGKIFQGYWINGKQHGFGLSSYKGICQVGEWRLGKKIRWIVENPELIRNTLNLIQSEVSEIETFISKLQPGFNIIRTLQENIAKGSTGTEYIIKIKEFMENKKFFSMD
jgi:hypothetical protein